MEAIAGEVARSLGRGFDDYRRVRTAYARKKMTIRIASAMNTARSVPFPIFAPADTLNPGACFYQF
jgi:hypothetical protein